MRKAVRADVGHLALNAILTQEASRKAGLKDASISTGSIYGAGLAVSGPSNQSGPSNVAAGCGNAINTQLSQECSPREAKEPQNNSTARLPAVPAVPTKDQCNSAMDQGIPARHQGISIKDPGSTTEVRGSCTEDQGIPAEAQRIPSEAQGVLMSQPAPAAVDFVLPATADDSSVAAGVEAHQAGMSPSSAGQGIADWLFFEPLTDHLHWLGPCEKAQPQRSPCLAAS